ncbi:MAG TPA: 30S ribosomal protein S3 [Spirochaetota bacterium]|jgi:small subunit ribosomal protein S3|nr:30S ribosomal protein S3 [Spirochaetota bacterium]HPF04745.1 30S ribosomal protein S3 [Spirochaetota bacterium]HPJ41138.1 30S ribosomal protein S3 [Spirochaetota bacterium]HPR37966.1 30S ribosomal protein S3 [Spirochaetota bacterium]HRX46844.1 30S ribosomal protein S3 [Spirochaetota bacterium]
MGQKVNPIGIRVGINRTWDSVWYDEKKEYAKNLHEDLKIKKFIAKEKKSAGIAKVTIERFPDRVNVNINASRPGVLIGKKGADIEELKGQLQKIASKTVYINIIEVKKPEKNSKLIAEQIASQIEGRFPYRRAVKQAMTNAMRSGSLGIKIMVSGRLNNAEMARTESFKEGRIPLHTLRADIDYGFAEALTAFGLIGVKVWLYNGDVLSKDQEDEEDKYSVKRKTR